MSPAALIVALVAVASGTCPADDLRGSAGAAVSAVGRGRFDDARTVATLALDGLHCMSRVASPEDLASLYLARAAAVFYAQPPGDPTPDLLAAWAVHPGWYEEALGPELRAAWAAIGASVPAGVLEVRPVPWGHTLLVDGRPLPPVPLRVGAGRHLVQVVLGDELRWQAVVDLRAGTELQVTTPLPDDARLAVRTPSGVAAMAFGAAGVAAALGGGVTWWAAPFAQALDTPGYRAMEVGGGAVALASVPLLATAALCEGIHLVRRQRLRDEVARRAGFGDTRTSP